MKQEDTPPTSQPSINFGHFRRVTPISPSFGYERGIPIDRYYIESFLAEYAVDIRGRVLEIGDDSYTRQFGENRVAIRDVLHVKEGNPVATFVGDLTQADHIPSDTFDCFICTQTLHLIYDMRTALETIYRILKPGGVLLATFPGISQRSNDQWAEGWYWSFTTHSAKRLFSELFPASHLTIKTYGNVLTTIAFLQGLALRELTRDELDYHDSRYEQLISVRVKKPETQ